VAIQLDACQPEKPSRSRRNIDLLSIHELSTRNTDMRDVAPCRAEVDGNEDAKCDASAIFEG
jgi:hypothetical protein